MAEVRHAIVRGISREASCGRQRGNNNHTTSSPWRRNDVSREMRRAALESLRRWLERRGGSVSRGLEIVEQSPGNLSLRATRAIKPFEILIQIPADCCLSEPIAVPTEQSPDAEGVAEVSLMRALAREKLLGPHSDHFAYLQSLPRAVHSFPQSWTPEQWRGLEKTTLHSLYRQRQRRYRSLTEISSRGRGSEEGAEAGEEERRWAECMVLSRSVSLENEIAMLPFIDLCNHDHEMSSEPLGARGCVVLRGKKLDGYADSIDGYSLVALAEHSPGMELLRCYGDLSFEDKICEFGWLDRERRLSAYSTMKLAIPLVAQHHLYGSKLRYSDSFCAFEGQQQFLFASVCEHLIKNDIPRGTFVRGLKRRLRELLHDKELDEATGNGITSSESASPSRVPSTGTALLVLSSQPVEEGESSPEGVAVVKRAILAMEIQKIEVLLVLLEKEERYRQFAKTKLPEIQREREEREAEESKLTEQVAMMLEQQTGLNLTQVLDGSEGSNDEEEFERMWQEGVTR